MLFFSGIMGSIVITDALKVGLAKKIKPWLNAKRMTRMRYISAFALVAFGIALILNGVL